MATKFPDLFIALAAPFVPPELKVRDIKGRKESYVTARTVMNRLDNVLGPESWWDEYKPGENSVLCKLTIRLPDGSELTKCDAGGYAGMADHGDDEKSGFSDAFKRAAVKFGVGRHLYRDGVPDYGPASAEPEPAALEPVGTSEALHSAEPGSNGTAADPDADPPPKSGKALFAKLKDLEQRHSISLIRKVGQDGSRAGFPDRMTEWTTGQIAEAWPHILALIERLGVKPVPEAKLRAYHATLWQKAVKLVTATIPGERIATQAECLQCVNRLVDALSPGERIERLGELRDVDQLVKLIELADEELRASAPEGGHLVNKETYQLREGTADLWDDVNALRMAIEAFERHLGHLLWHEAADELARVERMATRLADSARRRREYIEEVFP